nr:MULTISPECIES: MFS transporter [Rhodococcus]
MAAMTTLALVTTVASSIVLVMAAFALLGVGMGLANPPSTSSAVAALPSERAGSASAITSTSRQIGMNLGTATLGAVAVSVAGALAAPGEISPEDFTSGMRVAYAATAVLAVCCFLAARRCFPIRPEIETSSAELDTTKGIPS